MGFPPRTGTGRGSSDVQMRRMSSQTDRPLTATARGSSPSALWEVRCVAMPPLDPVPALGYG